MQKEVNGHLLEVTHVDTEDEHITVIRCISCSLPLGSLDDFCFPREAVRNETAWDWATRHATHTPLEVDV